MGLILIQLLLLFVSKIVPYADTTRVIACPQKLGLFWCSSCYACPKNLALFWYNSCYCLSPKWGLILIQLLLLLVPQNWTLFWYNCVIACLARRNHDVHACNQRKDIIILRSLCAFWWNLMIRSGDCPGTLSRYEQFETKTDCASEASPETVPTVLWRKDREE
jgi:hypothetical protein